MTNRIRNHSAAANAIWALVKGARDWVRSASSATAKVVLLQEDYLPTGVYAAHGQSLLDLRDWSERTGAELLVILTPGKNVDSETYEGTKKFFDRSGIKYADPVAAFLDDRGRTVTDLFWRFDSHLNSDGNRLLADTVAQQISESWGQSKP